MATKETPPPKRRRYVEPVSRVLFLRSVTLAKAETIRALELLEELMAVDINYRDVSKKVDEIRGM